MKTRLMTTVAVVAALATPLMASEELPVSEVDVLTDVTDPKSAEAMAKWPTIETDLEMAIAAKLGNPTERDTYKLEVTLGEVRLNDSPMLTDDGYFNTLSGVVTLKDDNFETLRSEPITVRAVEGEEPVDGIVYMTPDAEDFYAGLVNGFADAAIDVIKDAGNEAVIDNSRN